MVFHPKAGLRLFSRLVIAALGQCWNGREALERVKKTSSTIPSWSAHTHSVSGDIIPNSCRASVSSKSLPGRQAGWQWAVHFTGEHLK